MCVGGGGKAKGRAGGASWVELLRDGVRALCPSLVHFGGCSSPLLARPGESLAT